MTHDGSARDPRAGLSAAIAAAAATDDLDEALAGLLAAASDALGADLGAVFIQDPDRTQLVLAASVGLDEAGVADLQAAVADTEHPFHAATRDRVAAHGRESRSAVGDGFVGSYLPLVVTSGGVERILGSIGFVWSAPHPLDDAEVETLEGVAGLAALTIDRGRLSSTAAERSEWFERLAHSDPLTGLANERTVARVLELELARAGRQGSEVSLALFDVDDFRQTNQEGGQAAGDDVLRRVAEVLAGSVRLVDTVGRIGGDEFVLVAPGSAGVTVAERVKDGIAALPAIGGRAVSVSAGVARFPTDAEDAEALIAAATAALDQARGVGAGTVAASDGASEPAEA